MQILCLMKNFCCFLSLLTLLLSGCSENKYVVISGFTQGVTYNIKFNIEGVSVPKNEIALCIDSLLRDIDFSLSGYNHNSLLHKYNAGEDIVPDRYFSEILALSEKYKQLTNGAFDVQGAPLYDIWGFGFTSDSLPSPEKIQWALEETKKGKILNFNAIAQGYTCDVVAAYLYSIGVKDMLVDIGEIYCDGLNASGQGWVIGVDNPVDGNNSPGEDMRGIWRSDGKGQGVVTSGNYRKFYIKDGKKYAHTIDPRSGYPVEHELLSATIVAPTAAEADALATACMVLGLEESIALIESLEGVEGYLICSEQIWTSEGFRLEE